MRWTSSLNQAAAERDDIRGVFLIDLAFDSGHARANDGAADLVFGGNTYYQTGTFGTFDGCDESIEFVARGLRLDLSGADTGLIATIVNDVYQNRPATLYVGLLPTNSNDFVDTPEVVWSGYMDVMKIQGAKSTSHIVLQCEHRLRNSPPNSRWSDSDQKARSPGDRFFDICTLVEGFTSEWGNRGTTWGPKPGGGYGPG